MNNSFNNDVQIRQSLIRKTSMLSFTGLAAVIILFYVSVETTLIQNQEIPLLLGLIMLLIPCFVVVISLYLSRRIYLKSITNINAYADQVNELLSSKDKEIENHNKTEDELKKINSDLKNQVEQRDAEILRAMNKLRVNETTLKETEEKLQHQSLYDQLTNLPNRTQFGKYLERIITRPKRHKNYQFAVLLMDLDRFKILNDSLGHFIGDQLLIAVARRLENCLRPTDEIARFGGDEFAILLDDINDVKDATRVVERIQSDFSAPFELNEHEIYTTVSIGIALSATGYNSVDDIIRDADSAMYRAKALGRARFEIFHAEIHAATIKTFQLETELWQAIDNMDFLVYYQPIVEAKNLAITGCEALLRWKHPKRGFISPLDFIPLAEEIGLISAIGEWVLESACAQNKKWHNAGFGNLFVSVNFSPRQFHIDDIAALIERVLDTTDLSEKSLHVEITESVVMDVDSIKTLNTINDMGIHTSIDDFGTGYSSLGLLKRYPISAIKIDKSFIQDITIHSDVETIITAIIAMAHALKMKVVAEGVENSEQLSFLQSQNCDFIQGYLIKPPVSAEEFTRLLENENTEFTSGKLAHIAK